MCAENSVRVEAFRRMIRFWKVPRFFSCRLNLFAKWCRIGLEL